MIEPDENDLILDTLWGRVLEAWDDDKVHAAALDYAIRAEQLPNLAGKYRAIAELPDRAARAKKKLDGIVIAATSMLMQTKTPTRTKTPWWITLSALATSALLLSWLAYAILRRH